MDRLRPHWKVLLAVTVVAGIAIMVTGPNHTDLQMADDADEFRALLGEPGRHLAAALVDVVFAVAYGLLGVVGFRAVGGASLAARLGATAIAAGAVFDEIENVFLVANILGRRTLTDGWVDAMQVPGTLKWVATPGFLLLFAFVIVRAVRRVRGRAS